jgi:hemoglobin
MTTDTRDAAPSIYVRIGGSETVDRLVDTFYDNMDSLPAAQTIRAMHPENLGSSRASLKLYLAEWLGGPKDYSARKGHPRLRQRHMRFSIGPAERDAWLLCMSSALDSTIADAALRESLGRSLAGLADWMRNDPDNEHDKRH